MSGVEKGSHSDTPKYTRREFLRTLAAGLGGLTLIAAGRDWPPIPDEDPTFRLPWQVELDNMTLEETETVERYKRDIPVALTTLVSDFYVSTVDFDQALGLYGDYHWLNNIRRREAEVSFLARTIQNIRVFNEYGEDQSLQRTVILPGNCGFIPTGWCGGIGITPSELPGKPYGDSLRTIPEEGLQSVAQTFYRLPNNLRWERTSYSYREPFGEEVKEYPALKAGGVFAGKSYDLRIDTNGFSHLEVVH